uniref:ZIP-like iron-zinc transporter n=1 Tax=Schizophyllum commune (strain H4-8 / FGSC 9210) TaxID=578458 RepID=D8QII4_SCHCM
MALRRLSLICLIIAALVAATAANSTIAYIDKIETLEDVRVLESEIMQTAPVQKLSQLQAALNAEESPIMRQVFSVLFPFGPALNSILGTFYISSVPNFILAFIPAEIHGDTLNTMTAFATGGLLSDVFLHLVPHSFMGEHQDDDVHLVMVEPKRNILVGLAIFIGFASFFFMEKTLRVLSGEEGDAHGHSHAHGHAHSHSDAQPTAAASGVASPSSGVLRARGKTGDKDASGQAKGVDGQLMGELDVGKAEHPEAHTHEHTPSAGPSKLSAYLNLFGDFVHNITDGLAMAASFYASPLIGATTTLACFAHEIPHEIADYSILVRSGFTKRQAMQSQFLTAVGAFVRTFMGIGIHRATATGETGSEAIDLAAAIRQDAPGLLGTTVTPGDMVIPFVAGGFLYIGAVAVLPTLLAESKSAAQAVREFLAMALGVICMFLVAWNE